MTAPDKKALLALGRAHRNVMMRRRAVREAEAVVSVQANSPELQRLNERSLRAAQNGLSRVEAALTAACREWINVQRDRT